MKALVRTKNATVEVEGETQKALFQEVALAHEVFGEPNCGLCGCDDIVPVVRRVVQGKKVFEYPEYHCQNPKCLARLSLSYNAEGGTMFVNRALLENGQPATGDDRASGKRGKHRGWSTYWKQAVAEKPA
jgi:hypothetical protein